MDAEIECEIEQDHDAIQLIETIQSMIDVSADRLEGLRTQCSTSAELTQQEIRTLEGKLVKHFSRQLVIKARLDERLRRRLRDVPSLSQWLRVVGLGPESIEAVCSRVSSLEALRERPEHEVRALLANARAHDVRRLCSAMQRLRAYTEVLFRGEADSDLSLYWESWERARASPRPRVRRTDRDESATAHNTPQGRKAKNCAPHGSPMSRRGAESPRLGAPPALAKSRSHESQLARPEEDLSDTSQSSTTGALEPSPPASPAPPAPDDPPAATPPHHARHNNVHYNHMSASAPAPRSPRTPVGRCMAHDIAHRFTKTFNMIATCDYCDKQMLLGYWLKCKECKFKCHRDCESKVPPSCGLPPEYVNAFKEKVHKDAGFPAYLTSSSPLPARSFLSSVMRRRHQAHTQPIMHLAACPDSSSNTSSCNSSTPSSPAPAPPPQTPQRQPHAPHRTKQQFHFPEVTAMAASSPAHSAAASPARAGDRDRDRDRDRDDLTASVKSDGSRGVSLSGSGSTDSGGARADSLDLTNKDNRWPRQNSLSMKEWDIPYDELRLSEVIGCGRFGVVYRGSWHGAVAVKLLHVHVADPAAADDPVPLDTFKHEVATFRKTRHENLVLFMGACMKPPKLAIVTSLCKGRTLYTHIHLRKDKFTANKSVLVAQQISQGMGYLHARGIVHKDLKTKNIFLENGKVVITDFGLFSVTKLCFGNNARGDSLGIPAGWLCYLAPELARSLRPHSSLQLPFSKATDVYAFGTVWYELLCGAFPFLGQPAEAVIWQVGKGVKQPMSGMALSRDVRDILMMCWSYRASERPDFPALLATLQKLPRKRLARSPSHPVHLSRSADSVF